jgi:histidyl-tRNA synthetase
LVEQLGGKATPAVGFGMGLERLVLLLQSLELVPAELQQQADVYLVAAGNVQSAALQFAERLRDELPYLRVLTHCGGGSIKSQMKKADKSSADIALIMGEDEVKAGTLVIKHLRRDDAQQTLPLAEVVPYLHSLV